MVSVACRKTTNHMVFEYDNLERNRYEPRLALNREHGHSECYSFAGERHTCRTHCLVENAWERNRPK